MSLSTIVREKRKGLGLTQEQVADFLGVSAPAVNKWERGFTYPDITLLPALARLLKTDLNTLLCFNEKMSKKEMIHYLNHVVEVQQKEGLESAFTMAMEKVMEYPSDPEFLHSLAMTLQGALMMTELNSGEKEPYSSQITSLYERVAECGDSTYAGWANCMLASRLIISGEYHKAQEKLDALPEDQLLDKGNLQAQLWFKEGKLYEAAKLWEHKVMTNIQEIQGALAHLARVSIEEGDEQNAIRIAQCAQREIQLFGLWEYSSFVVPLEAAVSSRDVQGSLSILKEMLAAMLIPWDMKESPICRHIQPQNTAEAVEAENTTDTENKKNMNLGVKFLLPVLTELENSEEYDFLRSEPDFQQLLHQYRSQNEA